MLCQECQKNEANIFFKGILQNKVIQWSLCSDCAKEKGLEPGAASSPLFSIADFLSGLGEMGKSPKCSACGLRYSQFKQTGLLGCSRCYESFAAQLEPLLKRIHGTSQHSGKRREPPAKNAAHPEAAKELQQLKEALRRAIQREEYEKAAQIRDQIRKLI